jgi:hypothetical protein
MRAAALVERCDVGTGVRCVVSEAASVLLVAVRTAVRLADALPVATAHLLPNYQF